MAADVLAVHLSVEHSFSKRAVDGVELVEGIGVRGDAHSGVTVQHRSRVAADPDQPNLRQVHLIHTELFDALAAKGFRVGPGDLGENITTRGIDLLQLPVGTRLTVGDAVVTVTGLRNPCRQIDEFRRGLLRQVVRPDGAGVVERLTGVMASSPAAVWFARATRSSPSCRHPRTIRSPASDHRLSRHHQLATREPP